MFPYSSCIYHPEMVVLQKRNPKCTSCKTYHIPELKTSGEYCSVCAKCRARRRRDYRKMMEQKRTEAVAKLEQSDPKPEPDPEQDLGIIPKPVLQAVISTLSLNHTA